MFFFPKFIAIFSPFLYTLYYYYIRTVLSASFISGFAAVMSVNHSYYVAKEGELEPFLSFGESLGLRARMRVCVCECVHMPPPLPCFVECPIKNLPFQLNIQGKRPKAQSRVGSQKGRGGRGRE